MYQYINGLSGSGGMDNAGNQKKWNRQQNAYQKTDDDKSSIERLNEWTKHLHLYYIPGNNGRPTPARNGHGMDINIATAAISVNKNSFLNLAASGIFFFTDA